MDAPLGYAWILTLEKVDDRYFVDIYTGDYRCKIYFGGHFAMANRLKTLREAKVAELMRVLSTEEGPNGTDVP